MKEEFDCTVYCSANACTQPFYCAWFARRMAHAAVQEQQHDKTDNKTDESTRVFAN
jgi:hypothetical protein